MPIVKRDIASWLKNYAPAMPIALSMNRGQEYPNEDHAFCHGFDGMTLDSAVMTTQAEKYH
jgi:hypothetical protein